MSIKNETHPVTVKDSRNVIKNVITDKVSVKKARQILLNFPHLVEHPTRHGWYLWWGKAKWCKQSRLFLIPH